MKLVLLTFLINLSSYGVSDEECFPENDLSFPVLLQKSSENSLKMRAEQQIEHFKEIMNPFVKKEMHKELYVKLDWENPRVNASATRDDDDNPVLILFGGMVRHPQLTPDGLYAILCHELGHHLAGNPKKKRGRSEKLSWSSAEGQSDYYTTSSCLPKLFKKPIFTLNPNHYSDSKEVSQAFELCKDKAEEECPRMNLASLSMVRVFSSLRDYGELPRLELVDEVEAWETVLDHPRPQCRLDTLRAGVFSIERPKCWFLPNSL